MFANIIRPLALASLCFTVACEGADDVDPMGPVAQRCHVAPGDSIQAAIDDADCSVVQLADGVYTENLRIDRDLDLRGGSPLRVELRGDVLGSVVVVEDATVTIAGMTISRGAANDGGGIYNTGRLTLDAVVVRDNLAGAPTGGRGGGIYTTNRLELRVSEVRDNFAIATGDDRASKGGGIYAEDAEVVLSWNSTVAGNSARASTFTNALPATMRGGGIFALRSRLHINNSAVENNSALANSADSAEAMGGGIYAADSLVMSSYGHIDSNLASADTRSLGGGIYLTRSAIIADRASLHGNRARTTTDGDAMGGSIYAEATGRVELHDSSLHDNVASTSGNGRTAGAGIAVVANSALPMHVELVRSTLAHNQLGGFARNRGAGLYVSAEQSYAWVRMVNSTIANNDTLQLVLDGAGVAFEAAGEASILASLSNVTVIDNGARGLGADGIYAHASANATMNIQARNSLLPQSCDANVSFESAGYNLYNVSDDSCAFTGDTDTDVHDAPVTLELQEDGPTWVVPLMNGAGIDAGNPAGCTDEGGELLTVDQRGKPRAFAGRCDIGAYERN